MRTVRSLCAHSPFPLYKFFIFTNNLNFAGFFSSLALSSKPSNTALFNCLINTFRFSETRALTISNRYSRINSIEKPQSLYHFLHNLGFTHSHIQSTVIGAPQILFAHIDKSLKPKIELFQDLGLTGSDLGKFISKNSALLTASLQKRLVPRIETLKKLLTDDENNETLIKVIRRCNWIICKFPESRFANNIAFLKSCGIVGSQLSMLLRGQPRLFVAKESDLRNLVSRVLDMGFSVNSRMLVYALYTVSGIGDERRRKKFDLLKSFGFSEYECIDMFRKQPNLLRTSEKKLKLGLNFFLITMKLKKEVLIYRPSTLMQSMEGRVIPRHNVMKILKSKKLLKKEPRFIHVLSLAEVEFVQKFIAKFPDNAQELWVAYRSRSLYSDSSSDLNAG